MLLWWIWSLVWCGHKHKAAAQVPEMMSLKCDISFIQQFYKSYLFLVDCIKKKKRFVLLIIYVPLPVKVVRNWTWLSVGDWKTAIEPGAVVETQLFPFIFNEPAGGPDAGVVTIAGNDHCPGFISHFVSIWTPYLTLKLRPVQLFARLSLCPSVAANRVSWRSDTSATTAKSQLRVTQ